MKLFYFGSACSQTIFDNTVKKSKIKPSASAQNFENALINGFVNNGIDITAVSAESIATFPGGNRLFLNSRTDSLQGNCKTSILPAINLPLIKQICHARGASKLLKKWLSQNRDDINKSVLVYGIYPSVAKKLQRICKRYKCKIFAVVADVPSTMFTYTNQNSLLKRLFSGSYRKSAIAIQDQFDGYVYLTESMAKEVAPGKPYIVVETIADPTIFDRLGATKKADPPALMYAGALYKKYGVDIIVESFEKVSSDCELWLFGSGDYEEEIKKKAKYNLRIKFFGRVSREEVLRREKEATLLINIRNADDIYTKYSFPSKMVEYMLSGTPMLTTKLPGIPDEYYRYCFVTTARDTKEVGKLIDHVISDRSALAMGKKAKLYIKEKKNCLVQTNNIIEFMKKHI